MTDLQKRLEAICRLNNYEFAGEHRHCLELGAKVALEIDRSAPGAVDDSAPHVILAPHNCRICDSEPDVRPFGNDVVFSCENAECFMSDHDFTFSDWQTLMAAPGGDDDLKLLLRQMFEVCEATEEIEPKNDFERGRAFEAKSIRRSIGTWFQDYFCGRSLMGEPIINPSPAVPAQLCEAVAVAWMNDSGETLAAAQKETGLYFDSDSFTIPLYTATPAQHQADPVAYGITYNKESGYIASLCFNKRIAEDQCNVLGGHIVPLYTAPQAQPDGEIVVTWDESQTKIIAVTRQDEDGKVLSVIAEAQPAPGGEP